MINKQMVPCTHVRLEKYILQLSICKVYNSKQTCVRGTVQYLCVNNFCT